VSLYVEIQKFKEKKNYFSSQGFGLELSTYCHRKDEKMNIYIAIWDLERS
ncbi:hypothetical protein TNCT_158621, partial [Trichonephila clavata]